MNSMAVAIANIQDEIQMLERILEKIEYEIVEYEGYIVVMNEKEFSDHCHEALSEYDIRRTIDDNFQRQRSKRIEILFYQVEKKTKIISEKIGMLKVAKCWLETYDNRYLSEPLNLGFIYEKLVN